MQEFLMGLFKMVPPEIKAVIFGLLFCVFWFECLPKLLTKILKGLK